MLEIILSKPTRKAYIAEIITRKMARQYDAVLFSNVKASPEVADAPNAELKEAAKMKMEAMPLTNLFEAKEILVKNMLQKLDLDGKIYENITSDVLDELDDADYQIIEEKCEGIKAAKEEDKKK